MTSIANRHNWALRWYCYGGVTAEIITDVCTVLRERGATPWPDDADHVSRIEQALETESRCSLGFVREDDWSYPIRLRFNENAKWLSLVAGIAGTYALPFCSFLSIATDVFRAGPFAFGAIRPEFERSLPSTVTDAIIAEAGPAVWLDEQTARRVTPEWFEDGPAFATRRLADETAVALLSPDPTDETDRRFDDWFQELNRVRATLADAVGVKPNVSPLWDPDYRSVRLPLTDPDASLVDDPVGLLTHLGTWYRPRAKEDLERSVSRYTDSMDSTRTDTIERLRHLAEADERQHVRAEAEWALSTVC